MVTDRESSCLSNYLLSNLHPQSHNQWFLLFYFFLYFWNCNLIAKFLPFLSSLQTPGYNPPEFPQSIHSFSLIIIACIRVCIDVYISDTVCWVCSVLLLYIFRVNAMSLVSLLTSCFSRPSILILTHLHLSIQMT